MSEFAQSVCPRCGGAGHWVQETAGKPYTVRCEECKGSGMIEVRSDMMQGCRHNFPPDHVWKSGSTSDPYWMPQPSKTLLDEFAMAAVVQVLSSSIGKAGDVDFAQWSYEIAAAMMKERARRDEMGNVKEVK